MLAQRMLAQYDNHLDRLAQCSVEELCEFHGVGLAKATRLAAAFELVRRHKQTPLKRLQLNSSQSDQSLTKQFVKAGKNLDIRLLDHLIITENTYFSFANDGQL